MNWTDKIKVYNEDCMETMSRYEDNYFDLAIVDPPYKDDVTGLKAGFSRDFNYSTFKAPNTQYIKELFRVSKNQIIWGFNYFLEILPNTDSIIFWYKHQNGHFSEGEAAWCSLGKTRFFDRAYQKDIGNKIHPTQKPVALYNWLLDKYAKPDFKILDTHLGSGSNAIACHWFGCELVASELDKEYYQDSLKRFKSITAQQKMF
jgi:site-specific DNA-methyltransferase (adenine-specific)